MSPQIALFGHKLPKGTDLASRWKRIYTTVEGRDKRDELNLYVTGYGDRPRRGRGTAGTREHRPSHRERGQAASPRPSRPASSGEEKPDQSGPTSHPRFRARRFRRRFSAKARTP